jgi:hypothetical protein
MWSVSTFLFEPFANVISRIHFHQLSHRSCSDISVNQLRRVHSLRAPVALRGDYNYCNRSTCNRAAPISIRIPSISRCGECEGAKSKHFCHILSAFLVISKHKDVVKKFMSISAKN